MTLVQPDPEMQVLIRKELNEDINTRDASLQVIKEWLAKEPHLPDTWDENRMMTFLRGCNFSLEKTKRKLDLYFTMRTAAPEFFSNRDINRPELRVLGKYATAPPLPGLTPNGRRVVLICGFCKEVPDAHAEDALKVLLMVGDVRLGEEKTGVAGDIYILDASALVPAHFAKITPGIAKKFLVCVQEAYPVKVKEVHVINAHPLVDIIFKWVKPFVKEKIINRVHIHSNGYESLYNFVPREMLPEEYGGSAGKIQDLHDAWLKKLEEYTPWFKEQENIKADEFKRIGTPPDYDNLFGVDGSFRQLSID